MRNERNAGRKPKFGEGVATKMLHKLIPADAEKEIKQSIEIISLKWSKNK